MNIVRRGKCAEKNNKNKIRKIKSMKTTHESLMSQPGYEERKKISTAAVEFVNQFPFDYFFTLTFKKDVSRRGAEEYLKHFRNLLSTAAFGHNRRKKPGNHPFKVSLVAALESQSGGRLHWHVIMQPLHESSRIKGKVATKAAIKDCWRQCGGSTIQFDFQVINKYEQEKVIGYVLKETAYDTDTFFVNWFTQQK